MAFGVLEKPVGTLDLLVFLYRHGRTSINEILAETKMSKDTFYGAVNRLATLNLAYRDEQSGFPKYVFLALTKAGEDLARALLPGADMLASTSAALEDELARLERENNPKSIPRRLEILDLMSGKGLCRGDWDETEKKARRLAALAKETAHTDFEIKGRLTLGRVLRKRSRNDEASQELKEAVSLAEKHGADSAVADAEYELGTISENHSKWTEAADHFAIAGEKATLANATLTAARVMSATARLLTKQGKFEEALKINEKLVLELERLGADEDLPRIFVSIASARRKLSLPDSDVWDNKALEAARKVGDIRMEAYGLMGLSYHYCDEKQFKRAEDCLKQARQIFDDLGDRKGLLESELYLSNVCSMMSRWTDSDGHFDAALAMARELGSRWHEAYVFFNRGMMKERKGDTEAAEALYIEAHRIFLDIGSTAEAANVEERRTRLRATGTK